MFPEVWWACTRGHNTRWSYIPLVASVVCRIPVLDAKRRGDIPTWKPGHAVPVVHFILLPADRDAPQNAGGSNIHPLDNIHTPLNVS